MHDLLHTFEYLGMPLASLGTYARDVRAHPGQRMRIRAPSTRHGMESWVSPTAEFLPSDDEDEAGPAKKTAVWRELMTDIVPDHLPPQPPRHCWMFTPVYATQVLSELPMLQLVNRKLENARLVETSLRRLIRETDKAALSELNAKQPVAANTAETVVAPSTVQAEPEAHDSPKDAAIELLPAQDTAPAIQEAKPRLHTVNYKSSWYATLASTDSRLPTANLYTARLRGTVEDGGIAKRPRRYVI